MDVLWASAFGIGFLKPAPGSWGSAAAAVVWWLLLSGLPAAWQALICLLYFISAWWVSSRICRRYRVDDAPQIVADEVVGMWLALLFIEPNVWLAAAALALFRYLDIRKPGPIGWLDREVKGGLGVMLDDVLAGLLTGASLFLLNLALVTLLAKP